MDLQEVKPTVGEKIIRQFSTRTSFSYQLVKILGTSHFSSETMVFFTSYNFVCSCPIAHQYRFTLKPFS